MRLLISFLMAIVGTALAFAVAIGFCYLVRLAMEEEKNNFNKH